MRRLCVGINPFRENEFRPRSHSEYVVLMETTSDLPAPNVASPQFVDVTTLSHQNIPWFEDETLRICR